MSYMLHMFKMPEILGGVLTIIIVIWAILDILDASDRSKRRR